PAERSSGRDVARRPPPAPAARLRPARGLAPAPLQRPPRRHGPLAGRRPFRPDVRRSRAPRLLLPRELVDLARHLDPLQDAVRGPCAPRRLLAAVFLYGL